jgi:deoxyribodipyrimidine photo-lyase
MYAGDNTIFNTTLPNWKWDTAHFKNWCDGTTGVPLVDAAMRELKMTGCMHNRLRLVVSCYLVKILYIDWRRGEKWFAQHLLDYDPILNNANWQWITATLKGSKQPWFRTISPFIQSKKFDRECVYIKKWVPELADVSAKVIHKGEMTQVVDYEKSKNAHV